MARLSNHVEPSGAVAIARHYIRDLVYGANDGIITTFAVVAGAGGGRALKCSCSARSWRARPTARAP